MVFFYHFYRNCTAGLANALQFQPYSQVATFGATNGQFQATPTDLSYVTRGVSNDRAERQIAHFMDLESYQEQRRMNKQLIELGIIKPKKGKKPKVPKKKKVPAWLAEIQ